MIMATKVGVPLLIALFVAQWWSSFGSVMSPWKSARSKRFGGVGGSLVA